MAHTDSIDRNALSAIASQVALRLTRFPGDVPALSLHESFQLWIPVGPPLQRAAAMGQDLTGAVEFSGRWHHQLKSGPEAFGFARSGMEPNGNWRLHEMFESPIAAEIDRAIDIADSVDPDRDPLVRLLFAPSHQLYGLWLMDGSQDSRIIIAHCPDSMNLPRFETLGSTNFLRLLSAVPGVTGLTP
jgi:hypothetical protein